MKNIITFLFILISLNAMTEEKKETVGIVLSGGAARGFAHLGVLQALEDHGIVPTHVAGSSMGAVLGSVYAAGVSPQQIYNYARQQNYNKLYRPSLQGALFKPVFLEHMLNEMVPHNDFDSLQKKFYVLATNLNTAQGDIFSSGTFKDKVVASASIPFVFHPVTIDSFTYVDGGLVNNLPVEPLLEHCTHIIGVSVNSLPMRTQEELKGIGAIMRCLTMVVVDNELPSRKKCDYFIEVEKAGTIGILEFERVEDFYSIGYQTAMEYIKQNPDILKLSTIEPKAQAD